MGIWHSRVLITNDNSIPFYSMPKQNTKVIPLEKRMGKLGLLSLPNPKSFLYSSEGLEKISIAVDGRIDNQQKLCISIGVDKNEKIGRLITLLYKKYGSNGIYQLEGAFSLIMVDVQKRVTLLYRSFLTGYPLYFVAKNNLLTVSTNPLDILRRSDVSDSLDMEQLSGFFALDLKAWTNTVFLDIREVNYGEIVIISSDGIQSKKRALSEILVPQKYHSESEVLSTYRYLVKNSVEKNILPDNQYGIMLSSGMDSSTLAVFASLHLKKYANRLNAYSWSLPNYKNRGDESEKIKELCSALGIKLTLVNAERFAPFSELDGLDLVPDVPFSNPHWSMVSELYRAASNDGIDIMINGQFGDAIFPSINTIFSDIVRDGRYELFLPTMKSMVNEIGYLNTLKRLPEVQALKQYFLSMDSKEKFVYSVPEWLSDAAKESRVAVWKKKKLNDDEKYKLFSFALSKNIIDSGSSRYLIRQFNMGKADPFLDIKLLNYTLQLPGYMTYREGQKKYFARETMKGLLPESIRMQNKMGGLGAFTRNAFSENISEMKERLFDEPSLWSVYVDKSWMETKFKKNAKLKDQEMMVIWMSLHMAPWQRAIKSGGKLYEGL